MAVSPVEEVEAGGSQRVAVDCQGEEAGMETRGRVCWVAVVLLTKQRNRNSSRSSRHFRKGLFTNSIFILDGLSSVD